MSGNGADASASFLEGKWWDPKTPQNVCMGRVSFSDRSPELRYRTAYRKLRGYVHGVTRDGTPVTLWDTSEEFSNYDRHLDSDDDDFYWISHRYTHVIIGQHVDVGYETEIAEVSLQFDHLKTWFRLDEVLAENEEASCGQSVKIDYLFEHQIDMEVNLLDRPILELVSEPRGLGDYYAFSRYQGDNSALQLKFDKPLSSKLVDFVEFSIVRFIGFNYRQRVALSCRRWMLAGSDEYLEVHTRPPVTNPIGWSHFAENRLTVSGRERHPASMLKAWFTALTELYPLPQILAARHINDGGMLEQHVISALAGLEKAHSFLFSGVKPFGDEYFREKRDSLIAFLRREQRRNGANDEEFITMVGNVVQNSKSFSKKVEEIVDFVGSDALEVIGTSRDEFCKSVKGLRNRLVHTGSHVRAPSPGGSLDLIVLDYEVRAVLSLVVRMLMGLSVPEPERLKFIFQDNPRHFLEMK